MTRLTVLALAALAAGCADGPRQPTKSTAAKDSMTLAAFLAQRPEKPARVLVETKIENSREDGTFGLFLSNPPGDPSAVGGTQTLSRGESPGREAFEALKDGARHTVVLELKTGPGNAPEVLRVVEVLK